MRASLLLGLRLGGLGGCAGVEPYQRELLSLPGMQLDPDAGTVAEQHVLESREGSSGGHGALGGCGCCGGGGCN